MKRILQLLIIIPVFLGLTVPVNATLVLDQEVGVGNTSFGVDELFAQSFTVGADGYLSLIEVFVDTGENPLSFGVGLTAMSQSGTPPIDWQNELLFYENRIGPTNGQWYQFYITPIEVGVGDQFFIILENDLSNYTNYTQHIATRGFFYSNDSSLEDQYLGGKLWFRYTLNDRPDIWEEFRHRGADISFKTYIDDTSPVPPIPSAGDDQVVFDEVTLDGSGSSDTDGTIVSFDWVLQHREDSVYDRTAAGVSPIILNLEPGFYDVILTVTDDDGLIDTDTMLLAAAGPCVCAASKMHIQSIIARTAPATKSKKYGKVTVTIYDDCGGPVSNASVTGTFTGSYNEQITATTGLDGTAVLITFAYLKKPSYTFCVDDVNHGSLTYDSSGNVETCKSK